MEIEQIKEFLDIKVKQYNHWSFIASDPISIPHQFKIKQDIEISAFLTSTIAWGNRKMIIQNAQKLMHLMDDSPYDFVKNFEETDINEISKFVHRTFNGNDCIYFIKQLQRLYKNYASLENVFFEHTTTDIKKAIVDFRNSFLSLEYNYHVEKHISNPDKNSAAKRLNMFLRWMIRKDDVGVDFGIWRSVKPYILVCPLDLHSGNTARALGILNRKQNDWQAAQELTNILKSYDSEDPIKYDFALFGLGVNEKFKDIK